jgi:hypothetical protein
MHTQLLLKGDTVRSKNGELGIVTLSEGGWGVAINWVSAPATRWCYPGARHFEKVGHVEHIEEVK